MYFKFAVLFVLITLANNSESKNKNNVCQTWDDYDTIPTNPNCWYNPDVGSTTEQIVARNGYSLKEYTVETSDGYLLTLFRIGKGGVSVNPKEKQPIFMMHGLGAESTFWVAVSNRSLVFSLVNDDYDVWLGNVRGNRYGRRHKRLSPRNRKFWDFTIDDIAMEDLPAQLDLVRNETGSGNKIIYVGHSMGTTIGFMYSIAKKEEAEENLMAILALAPSAYLQDMTYLKYIIPLVYPVSVNLEKTLSALRLNTLMSSPELSEVINSFCTRSSAQYKMCFYVTQIMFGFDSEQFLPEDFPLLLSYVNSGISMKCVTHYLQMSGSKKFQRYDFGKVKNMRMYGNGTPSEYQLEKIDIPVHLFNGKNDALTTNKNVNRLYRDLNCQKSLTVISEDGPYHFNHIDYIFAKDVVDVFNKPFMQLLDQELSNNKIKRR